MPEILPTPNPTWTSKKILSEIWGHVSIMNRELGVAMNDVAWIKRFLFVLIPALMAIIGTVVVLWLETH